VNYPIVVIHYVVFVSDVAYSCFSITYLALTHWVGLCIESFCVGESLKKKKKSNLPEGSAGNKMVMNPN